LSLHDLSSVACFSTLPFSSCLQRDDRRNGAGAGAAAAAGTAAVQLKLSSLPVIEIAMNAGYGTHESFSRAFKAAFAYSPSQYRMRNRGRWAILAAPSNVHYNLGNRVADFKTLHRGVKTMEVTIRNIEPMVVAFMRHNGPYATVGETWNKFIPWMGKEGFLGGGVQCLGICHDDPDVTLPEKIKYDACVTVR